MLRLKRQWGPGHRVNGGKPHGAKRLLPANTTTQLFSGSRWAIVSSQLTISEAWQTDDDSQTPPRRKRGSVRQRRHREDRAESTQLSRGILGNKHKHCVCVYVSVKQRKLTWKPVSHKQLHNRSPSNLARTSTGDNNRVQSLNLITNVFKHLVMTDH